MYLCLRGGECENGDGNGWSIFFCLSWSRGANTDTPPIYGLAATFILYHTNMVLCVCLCVWIYINIISLKWCILPAKYFQFCIAIHSVSLKSECVGGWVLENGSSDGEKSPDVVHSQIHNTMHTHSSRLVPDFFPLSHSLSLSTLMLVRPVCHLFSFMRSYFLIDLWNSLFPK